MNLEHTAEHTMGALAGAVPDGVFVVGADGELEEAAHDRLRLREAHRLARLVAWDHVPGSDTIELTIPGSHVAGLGLRSGPELDEVLRLLCAADEHRLREALDRVASGASAAETVAGRLRFALGPVRWVETRVRPVRDGSGAVVRLRGTIQDVTAHRDAEREIDLQGQLLDAVDVAVVASDADGTVTHFNRGAEHIYGWARDEALGRPVAEVMPADGPRFPVSVRESVFSAAGEAAGTVVVSSDITERVETERRLRAARDHLRAVTDSMGEGLFTLDHDGRLTYMNRVAEELLGWSEAELLGEVMHERTHFRCPDGLPLAFDDCPLMHARRDDRVVRLAEEVFVRKDGTDVPVQITAAPFDTDDGVRGSVVVFSDITERKAEQARLQQEVESITWVARVREALSEQRFVLYAQPIIEVSSGGVVQHELLIRMLDRDGQVIAPGRFLPAAEEDGIIVDVDRWVIAEAVALAARGHAVELNLSARTVATPAIADEFRRALEATGADASLIVVELTETALLEDGSAAENFIAELKALGCRLALDDFGTGYGGFTYFKRLPVDYLKIDTEFVCDVLENEASRQVVGAVVSLARGCGQLTVAEGVEDLQTLTMLAELGVDYAQGYAIARPAPVSEVLGCEAWPEDSDGRMGHRAVAPGARIAPEDVISTNGGPSAIEVRAVRALVAREVPRRDAPEDRAARPLTAREVEVLQRAADGGTTESIAAALFVSASTVKTHFEHLYDKLGVTDRAAAVAQGLRRGLIQ